METRFLHEIQKEEPDREIIKGMSRIRGKGSAKREDLQKALGPDLNGLGDPRKQTQFLQHQKERKGKRFLRSCRSHFGNIRVFQMNSRGSFLKGLHVVCVREISAKRFLDQMGQQRGIKSEINKACMGCHWEDVKPKRGRGSTTELHTKSSKFVFQSRVFQRAVNDLRSRRKKMTVLDHLGRNWI